MTGTQTSSGITPAQSRRVVRAFSLEQIKDAEVRDFALQQPRMTDLRKRFGYHDLLPLMHGRFIKKEFPEGQLNRYPKPEQDPNTRCASWTMFDSVGQNFLDTRRYNTYGILAQGEHEFSMGEYFERMNVLSGELTMEVMQGTEEEVFLLNPGQGQIIPAHSKAIFRTGIVPVRYICEYDKEGFRE